MEVQAGLEQLKSEFVVARRELLRLIQGVDLLFDTEQCIKLVQQRVESGRLVYSSHFGEIRSKFS